ncbi:MAG: hypothetical protein RL721_2257 [Candidatus Eisenbacteria bacterium]
MVRLPRFGRLRIPRLTPHWRARIRAQRAWWRRRLRLLAGDHEVLFPADGGGVVAIETLSRGTGPRIAILHATAGSGHRSAALAIAKALGQLAPGAQVREVDTLVYASRFYRTTFSEGYNAMAARAPRLWGALYALWAQEGVNRSAGPAREAFDRLALRKLVRVVERERPDAIVCTHFLPVEALYPSRGRGRLAVPIHVVITDFTAHPLWAYPYVDRYYVASDAVADELAGHGVPRERIEVTGIPVDPRFEVMAGREAVRARFGFAADRPLVLGGVTIPFDRGLLGHSDADVVCHALTDAVLGAAGAGDIGRHFPDTDPQWKGADSLLLLRQAVAVVQAKGFAVANVDITVIAQRPKLSPHVDAMRQRLASALGCGADDVSVKGKTNEGVDSMGEGTSIAAHAVALLVRG